MTLSESINRMARQKRGSTNRPLVHVVLSWSNMNYLTVTGSDINDAGIGSIGNIDAVLHPLSAICLRKLLSTIVTSKLIMEHPQRESLPKISILPDTKYFSIREEFCATAGIFRVYPLRGQYVNFSSSISDTRTPSRTRDTSRMVGRTKCRLTLRNNSPELKI